MVFLLNKLLRKIYWVILLCEDMSALLSRSPYVHRGYNVLIRPKYHTHTSLSKSAHTILAHTRLTQLPLYLKLCPVNVFICFSYFHPYVPNWRELRTNSQIKHNFVNTGLYKLGNWEHVCQNSSRNFCSAKLLAYSNNFSHNYGWMGSQGSVPPPNLDLQ